MNEHTGFELQLSDYEKGYLTSYYDNVVSPDFKDGDEQSWYGMQIGDRMFDLNAWLDEEAGEMVCVVYLCVEKDGEFTADTSTSWFLKEAKGWV